MIPTTFSDNSYVGSLGLLLVVFLLSGLATDSIAQQREVKQLSPEKLENIQLEKLEERHFPTLTFRVLDVVGDPTVLPADEKQWRPLREDDLLGKGARIVTLEGDSVQLKIPGISLIRLEEETEVILEELTREIQYGDNSNAFQFGARPDASQTVEIKALEGEVQNSISDRLNELDQTLEYKLKTPQSVAGVRGTTFNCSVNRDETECTVLEGQIRLAALERPQYERVIEAGYRSTVKDKTTRPDTPVKISAEALKKVQNVIKNTQQALKLEPFVGDFVIAGKEPRPVESNRYTVEVAYNQPRKLTLGGRARAREPGASLKTVTVRFNGDTYASSPENEWSVSVRPDTVYPGQRRRLDFTIQAIDDTGTRSIPKKITVELVNRDVASIIPKDLDKGTVPVKVTGIGRQDLKEAKLPFHLFVDDLETNKNVLQVIGQGGDYSPVKGVAYSLDQGVTWKLADGTFQWEFMLPVDPTIKRELRPWFRAWTREGTIGGINESGPYVFHPKSFSQHLSDQLRRLWQTFVNRDIDGIRSLTTDNLKLEDDVSGRILYHDRLIQAFKELFAVSRDMSVSTQIHESSAGRNRANLSYSLEVNGRQLGTEKRFKILSPYVYMAYRRGPDGRFLVRRITDLLTKRFIHTPDYETVRFGQGYDIRELEVTSKKVGLVQFNRYGEKPDAWTLKEGTGLFEGGLLNLGSTSLSKAFPLPEVESSDYSTYVYIQPGNLYVLNARIGQQQHLTTFFKFKDLTTSSLKVQVYTIRDLPGF